MNRRPAGASTPSIDLPAAAGARRTGGAAAVSGQGGTICRYRDPTFDAIAVKLLPGECYITQEPEEMIVTLLGSCVAACIRDPLAGIGGMNHFMLPESAAGEWPRSGESLRYGNFAMVRLLNELLARGCCRQRLEVKVFGGAHVLGCAAPIGDQNAAFVEAFLAGQSLPISARHMGGRRARRIHYFPFTGDVFMLEMRRQSDPGGCPSREQCRARHVRARACAKRA